MAQVIDFPSKKKEVEKCSLFEWTELHHNESDFREVFLNMDIALKYIHDHGYCIESFYPTNIHVLNNNPEYIQFDNLMELSHDPVTRQSMIKEDIFRSSFIQIALYTNTIRSLTPEFLKENFDSVIRFVPEGDVPYYRGVVQRGASVYFSEFALEKMNRDLQQLEKELEGTGEKADVPRENEPLSNDKINDRIYRQINGMKDAAFISYLLIPTFVIVSLVLIAIISWILSLF
ncbi:MAG: hypothetical protein J6X28_01645 [Bacilli bacterium]|nr:hypothetical protein [Bacilli bacterium]